MLETEKPFIVSGVYVPVMEALQKEFPWAQRVEELFFRFGIRGVTMDDIAAHLGISKKTLYQYVQSKDDLIIRILELHFDSRKALAAALADRADNAVDEFLLVLAHNLRELERMGSNLLHDLQKYHHTAWLHIQQFRQDYLVAWVSANILRGRAEGLYRMDFNAEITARLHIASTFAVFDPEWFPDTSFSKQEVLETFMVQFLYGIASPAGLTYLQQNIKHHA